MTTMVDAVRALAPEPDATAFRNAMARLVSAVHIVTTAGAAGRAGLTATAIASVSDAPPMVLACIEARSRTLAAIRDNGIFCINTLAGPDAELAEIFASRRGIDGEARFASPRWGRLASGAPVLDGAIASFDCRLSAIHDAASHRIVIGEVVALGGAAQPNGLVYRDRHFEAL